MTKEIYVETPKFLIKDLKKCRRMHDKWKFDIQIQVGSKEIIKTISFNKVCVQGIIEQKPCDDVMILRDCSGRVKLSNCSSAESNKTEIVKGAYCYAVGNFVQETGLPEISTFIVAAMKLKGNELYDGWPAEVTDFQLYCFDILKPILYS